VSQGIVELRVVGKGSKSLKQEWTSSLQQGLLRYRTALGLHWLPKPGETMHLYCGRCRETGVSQPQLYRTLHRLGAHVPDWVAPGRLHPQDMDKLRGLGPYTMRHTAVTIRINLFEEAVLSVRNHLGHASIQTTESYLQPVRLGEGRD
jgi:integrase